MLLTLGLAESRRLLWGGVSSGVQVVRATSTQAEVIAESKSCSGDWREPVALSLGEGWRALPSDAVRLSWPSQPNESMVVAVTQQRGHVGACWAESYMIGRKWLPEAISGPLPVDDPPVFDPGVPMCPVGTFWAVRFEGISLCGCGQALGDTSVRLSGPVPGDWMCMEASEEFSLDGIPPIALPVGWPRVERYAGAVCGGAAFSNGLAGFQLFTGPNLVAIEVQETPSGDPGRVFVGGGFGVVPPSTVGGEVIVPSNLVACGGGLAPAIATGGFAVLRRVG